MSAVYLEVSAEVRYWEDATVNGVTDEAGTLIPSRKGECWAPIIRLADGAIVDWPQGTFASVHYKVCDQGEYWLLDADKNRIKKWAGDYVPDAFLCHGAKGWGDYIIFNVSADGIIEKWALPSSREGWSA